MPSLPRCRHAAFTVIELVLAMILAGVLALSALALFSMLVAAERRLSDKFDDAGNLLIAQLIVRRAMGSLIAGKPEQPGLAAAENAEAPDARTRSKDIADLIVGATGDEQLARELAAGLSAEGPMLDLYFNLEDGLYLPALQVKVMESPVPSPADSGSSAADLGVEQFLPVRGVFETIRLDNGLAIQWRPIAPPGPPTLIIRDLAAVEWYALPHNGEWTDVYAAYLQSSFPAAMRLVLWTNKGTHVDWLFDAAPTTPETP